MEGALRLTVDEAVRLVGLGEAGEAALVEVVRAGRNVVGVAALGEAAGPAGVGVLRNVALDDRRSDDERCAALVALAKRSGREGSDCYARALGARRSSVKHYAILCLCAFGDDRAWDAVLARLKATGSKLPDPLTGMWFPSSQPAQLVAIGYLARHAGTSDRADALSRVVRPMWERWSTLQREWIQEFWPGAPLPDASPSAAKGGVVLARSVVERWTKDPMFEHLYRGV